MLFVNKSDRTGNWADFISAAHFDSECVWWKAQTPKFFPSSVLPNSLENAFYILFLSVATIAVHNLTQILTILLRTKCHTVKEKNPLFHFFFFENETPQTLKLLKKWQNKLYKLYFLNL